MSSKIDLRVSRSLELLGSLKQTASDFAKKEDQLTRDLSSRRYAINRKYWDAIEETETKLSKQLGDADSFLKSEVERIRSIHESRREWIQHAHAATIRNLPKRVHEARGEWLGNLQVRQLDAKRCRDNGLNAAESAFAAFAAKLAEQRAALVVLLRSARRSFTGYFTFRWMIRRSRQTAAHTNTEGRDENQLLDDLRAQLRKAEEQLGAFRRFLLARIFSFAPLPALALLIAAGVVALAYPHGFRPASNEIIDGIAVLAAVFFLHRIGKHQSKSAARALAATLDEASAIHDASWAVAHAKREEGRKRIQENYERTIAEVEEQWGKVGGVEVDFEKKRRAKIEAQVPRLIAKNTEMLCARLKRLEAEAQSELIKRDAEIRKQQFVKTHETEMAALIADENARWEKLQTDWKREMIPIYQAIGEINAATSASFPAWDSRLVETWKPAATFTPATKFAHLDFDFTKHADALPKDPRLALPGSSQISIPLALTFPDHGSLLFETSESGEVTVIGTINNIILRLLAATPPGKLSFTIIDPVGLGESFAGLMHLADYEESLINRRIWTQRDQIEERLAEMSEHIEKVIQMYLRNEYATITEYNEQAGSVAEKYHFLVVADFPANFSETAAKRLQSIAASGPRCGIFTLIHWDQRQPLPDGFVPDELRKNSICIGGKKNEFTLKCQSVADAALVFDAPPNPDLAVELVHKIGKSSIDSNRVEVPFEQIAPKPSELWTNDTTNELKIAIGRTGATKMQYLAIGKGTRQHALFAGKTGSGKSTLFHVIITNLALACSPDQVEFYLIDFKKGVEFKCYATKRLPHARVVAIESDREFALSVLQRVDEELKRRGDLFRKLGVQDIAGYKKAGGTEPMPRSLLLIDEFQEFFVEDDTIAQTASLLFDRIVRQGRAFGIHVLLGSQTLGGAYSLARATLGQMVIRVALQCNEADAYLIMDDSNPAPRLLSRPGEGIYNDAAGALAGNSPFQVVWLPDDERDAWLDKVHDLAVKKHDRHSGPIVFEGNAPADIRENDPLRSVLEAEPAAAHASARVWLGAPNSIKGPTEAVFQRQSGNHLLIVGQRDEAALTMLGLSLLALAAQYPVGAAKFVLFNSANPGSPDAEFIERILKAIPHGVTVARGQEIAQAMNDIAAEMKNRSAGETQANDAPPVFVFIHGLHKFKKLRHEDDFSFSTADAEANPGAQFNDLICEGSSLGMHIITTVDTFNNVNRAMSRKALSEFEMRVVFQMSANDSASLIDSPKASNLGLHRALFYSEQQGTLETFRPYATPDAEWIREAGAKLARLPLTAPVE